MIIKTIKEKYLLAVADFAGYPLKEAVVAHLKKDWKITDLGVTAESDPNATENRKQDFRGEIRTGASFLRNRHGHTYRRQ